jgi:hypothetical protein
MNHNVWWIAQIEARERFDNAQREVERISLFRKVRDSERKRVQRGSVHTIRGRLSRLECQVREALYRIEAWLAIPWARQEGPGHVHGCD